MSETKFPEKLTAMGYTEEGLAKDNPYNRVEGFHEGEPLEKNPLVIYHGNCADGFSAAWCFYHFGQQAEQSYDFHAGVYNDAPPDVTGRIVYLVDFSYKRAVVEEMLKTAKVIYFIDHHKSAIEDLIMNKELPSLVHEYPNFVAYTDLERSGAMLAWDFLYNTIWDTGASDTIGIGLITENLAGTADYIHPPLLLEHIQDRDLWKFKLPNTREINAAVFSYDYTFENWDMLMLGSLTDRLNLTIAGSAIERKHHKDITELINVTRRFLPILDYIVPVASLPYTMSSDACHVMAQAHADGKEFAACYWDTADHRIFSLRSCSDGVDVSVVAARFGGGGHRNAAGFRVHRNHILARS